MYNIKFKDYFYNMTDIPDIQKKTTPDNTGNQKPELYGVGGWLLFFWISLVFFDPLYTVVTQYQFFDMQELTYPGLENYPEWGNMKWFFWGMTIFCIMLSWIAGYFLNCRYKWSSVRLAILILWVTGPLQIVLATFYLGMNFENLSRSYLFVECFWAVVKSSIITLLWMWYLLKSERVRNTYVKNDPVRE